MRTTKSLARWLAPVSLLVSGSICSVEAYAHGYISSPKSRVIMCAENGIENPTLPACIAAKAAGNEGMYTPQEISVGGVYMPLLPAALAAIQAGSVGFSIPFSAHIMTRLLGDEI